MKVSLGRAKSVADTRETFWSSYRAESASLGDSRTYSWYEQRLRSNFPAKLQDQLRHEIPDISVVFSNLRYGSLEATLTAVSAGFAALGLTADDAVRLIQQYVPLAFAETFEPGAADLDFQTRVETEAHEPISLRQDGASRTGTFVRVAVNTTLLLLAAVLLAGAFLLFRAANDTQRDLLASVRAEQQSLTDAVTAERARFSDALIAEQTALAGDRKARVVELDGRVKALESQLADMNGRWAQLLLELQKARVKATPDPKPGRRR